MFYDIYSLNNASVWIVGGATILPRVTIGDAAFVGAESLSAKVVGSPARVKG
jgi:acetyltransferase-like isoleucine patch superfamily enzyme